MMVMPAGSFKMGLKDYFIIYLAGAKGRDD